jgi:hypothetical protein
MVPNGVPRGWACGAWSAMGAATVLVDKKAAGCEAVDAVLGYSTDRRMVSMRMSMRW